MRAVYRAMFLMLALSVAGCVPARQRVSDEFDPEYLAPEREKTTVSFGLTFVDYAVEETGIIEAAWARAAQCEAGLASLWAQNGLRIAVVAPNQAQSLDEELKRLRRGDRGRNDILLPHFEVTLGRREGAGGLIYLDGDQTSYRDVTDLAVIAKVKVYLDKGGARAEVCPSFSGAAGVWQDITGLIVQFPVEGGSVIMIGHVAKPPQKTLGAAVFARSKAGPRGALVLAEVSIAR